MRLLRHIFPTKPEVIELAKWAPQEDITVFELAQCTGLLVWSTYNRHDWVLSVLKTKPPEVRRHFTFKGEPM